MRSLQGLLPGFLRQISNDPELSLIFLRELWPRIVGEHVARRAEPAALKGGVLTCRVGAGAWQGELSRMSPMLAGAVNQFWGCSLVDRIRFVRHLEESH